MDLATSAVIGVDTMLPEVESSGVIGSMNSHTKSGEIVVW